MDETIKIWVPFIGFFSSILLAIFVLGCNPRSWIFRTYFLYALNLAILNLGLLGLPSLLNIGLILLPISFFQFVLSLRKSLPPRDWVILGLAYLVGIVLLFAADRITYYDLTGSLFFGGLLLYSTYLLYLRERTSFSPLEKNRNIYLLLAIWMILLKSLIDIFDSLGWVLSPLWNLTLVFQPFIMAYAIMRLRPVDIFVILRKTTIYTIISLAIMFSYFVILRIFEDFCRVVTGIELAFLPALLAGLTMAIFIQGLGEPFYTLIERTLFTDYYRKWSLIQRLNQSLSSIFNIEIFLGTILNAVTTLVDIDKSSIILWNRNTKRYEIQFAFGLSSETKRKLHFKKDSALIKWLGKNRSPILIEDVMEDPLFEGTRAEIIKELEGIESKIAFPFTADLHLVGFLSLGRKKDGRSYRWEEIRLISDLCQQISGALVSMTVYDQKIKQYLSIIQSFIFSMEAKDRETKEHCERVAEFATAIGRKMNLQLDTVESLRLGGMIHDIGKVTIPNEILLKPGSLTDDEFEKIKRHTQAGLKILVPVQFSDEVIASVLSHHERLSGAGYPEALKGEEIPLVARIMAVADVYDAMTSDRQYRKSLSREEVKAELLRGSGKEYDPEVVAAFLAVLEEEPPSKP